MGIWDGLSSSRIGNQNVYHYFAGLPYYHTSIAMLGLIVLCGFILGYRSLEQGYRPGIAALLGGFAGLMFGIMPWNPVNALAIAIDPLRSELAIFIVAGIVICTPLGALSAYIFIVLAGDKHPRADKNKIMLIASLALVAIVVTPLIATAIGLEAGLIDRHVPTYQGWPVSVERVANNTIVIANDASDRLKESYNSLTDESPFTIIINGKDASNASLIKESGLLLEIYPAAGLTRKPGSRVTLAGLDVSAVNETSITIVAYFRDGTQIPVYSKSV